MSTNEFSSYLTMSVLYEMHQH